MPSLSEAATSFQEQLRREQKHTRQMLNKELELHKARLIAVSTKNAATISEDLENMRQNLDKMINIIQAQYINVLLVGFKVPTNYGSIYKKKFERVFKALVDEYKLDSVPFLLEGVALKPEYMLKDGLHPMQKHNQLF